MIKDIVRIIVSSVFVLFVVCCGFLYVEPKLKKQPKCVGPSYPVKIKIIDKVNAGLYNIELHQRVPNGHGLLIIDQEDKSITIPIFTNCSLKRGEYTSTILGPEVSMDLVGRTGYFQSEEFPREIHEY